MTENLTGQPTVDKFFQTLTDFNSYITGAYTPLILLYGTDMPYAASAGAEDVNTPSSDGKDSNRLTLTQ